MRDDAGDSGQVPGAPDGTGRGNVMRKVVVLTDRRGCQRGVRRMSEAAGRSSLNSPTLRWPHASPQARGTPNCEDALSQHPLHPSIGPANKSQPCVATH